MARYDDLDTFKNEREKMNVIRERVSKVLYEASKDVFGEEFTRYIPKDIGITENASKVSKFTVVADVGDLTDNGGCPVGACVAITVKVKKWNTVENKNGGIIYGITLDDYDEALKEKEGE